MRQPRHRRGHMALRRREARQSAVPLEPVQLVAGELAALDGKRADQAVVAARDVARAGRFRDLRVVELGRVAVDVENAAAERLERPDDEVLEDGLLRRAGADAMAADRVEAQLRGRSSALR